MRLRDGRLTGPGTVRFTWDGREIAARRGDTVASALMAADERVVGRAFKYHRPRGTFALGSEEPNALVTTGSGPRRVPNVRATEQEAFEGLRVRSQNAWPSVRRDAMAVNDLLAPFLGAGFYYKTFMWPPRAWERLYEPVIRRAAGLGALSGRPAPDEAEKAFAHCDLLVIGAGPAGLMAALAAAGGGADVILCTEEVRAGGRLLSEDEEIDGRPGHEWAAAALAELEGLGVRVMTRTTVTGAYDHGTYGALERVSRHLPPRAGLPPDCFWRITAKAAVLAAGAIERPIAFPDNDRPGVMLAGAVRGYLHRHGTLAAPHGRVAVFGSTDEAWRTARDLQAAGADVTALIDARPGVTPGLDVRTFTGARVIGTEGRHGLTEIIVHDGTREHRVRAGCLAMSGGWNPAVHLTCHLGARPVWDEGLAAFLPAKDAVPGLHPAGAANGVLDTAGCLKDGVRAAKRAAKDGGFGCASPRAPRADGAAGERAAIWLVDAPKAKGWRGRLPARRAWLDLQNDVTAKDVHLAAREGFGRAEHMKRYTTQGMAPDQGKTSNVAAMAVLADATGRTVARTGTTTFRPPFVPVPIAAMGAGASGRGFAPERRTASHDAALADGAPMIEAGLWFRPSYFPRDGEATWREACDREVRTVRGTVGVCDVSTLGKIEVIGPDAGAFLDFVYANRMSTLAAGRVRYGVMLREDGHVMDDGTCARIAQDRFLVTTTTAAAGAVMRHMEHAAQVLRPDLDVSLISATEQWAQFAVAGPRSDALLAGVLDDLPEVPFMGWAEIRVGGVAARLYRISFSGERACELAVPARFGAAMWDRLVAAAEAMDGCAYGMEALNVLRIEKGFPTHAEMDGRTTADDLGLGAMVRDGIGVAAAGREGLSGPRREQLVGLEAGDEMHAGAFLFTPGTAHVAAHQQGHLKSVCHSPTLGRHLALALLRNGRARHGERLVMVDHLRGREVRVTVRDPRFLDPAGGRMRG
ncbi:MAG: 2Fe-2S iron-sulfur cluster-binding protein [Hasllibacter sp.]